MLILGHKRPPCANIVATARFKSTAPVSRRGHTAAVLRPPLPPAHDGRDLLQELRDVGWKVLGHTDDSSLSLTGRNIVVVVAGR